MQKLNAMPFSTNAAASTADSYDSGSDDDDDQSSSKERFTEGGPTKKRKHRRILSFAELDAAADELRQLNLPDDEMTRRMGAIYSRRKRLRQRVLHLELEEQVDKLQCDNMCLKEEGVRLERLLKETLDKVALVQQGHQMAIQQLMASRTAPAATGPPMQILAPPPVTGGAPFALGSMNHHPLILSSIGLQQQQQAAMFSHLAGYPQLVTAAAPGATFLSAPQMVPAYFQGRSIVLPPPHTSARHVVHAMPTDALMTPLSPSQYAVDALASRFGLPPSKREAARDAF